MEGKRTVDLVLIAIVVTLLGIYVLIESAFSIGYYGDIRCLGFFNQVRLVSAHILALFTVTGIGIFFRREWARKFTVIVAVYSIIYSVYEYLIRTRRLLAWEVSQPDFWLEVILPFCACVFLVIYLRRLSVRGQFE